MQLNYLFITKTDTTVTMLLVAGSGNYYICGSFLYKFAFRAAILSALV